MATRTVPGLRYFCGSSTFFGQIKGKKLSLLKLSVRGEGEFNIHMENCTQLPYIQGALASCVLLKIVTIINPLPSLLLFQSVDFSIFTNHFFFSFLLFLWFVLLLPFLSLISISYFIISFLFPTFRWNNNWMSKRRQTEDIPWKKPSGSLNKKFSWICVSGGRGGGKAVRKFCPIFDSINQKKI